MLRIGLFLLMWSALNDPLLQIIYSIPEPKEVRNNEPQNNDDYSSDESYANGEYYSWDNLYLCTYCETEIIVNPYE